MSNRFGSVKYDEIAELHKGVILPRVEGLELQIESLEHGKNKGKALDALELFYMYAGKALRDDQLARDQKVLREAQREAKMQERAAATNSQVVYVGAENSIQPGVK